MELTNELQETLATAVHQAQRRRHEYLLLEHVLFAMAEDKDASIILRALGVDLTTLQADIEQFFAESIEPLEAEGQPKYTPTLRRVIERAARQLQAAEKDTIGVGNLLAAFYLEPASHAVYLLQKQGVTRLNVLEYVAHGISAPGSETQTPGSSQLGYETEGAEADE